MENEEIMELECEDEENCEETETTKFGLVEFLAGLATGALAVGGGILFAKKRKAAKAAKNEEEEEEVEDFADIDPTDQVVVIRETTKEPEKK